MPDPTLESVEREASDRPLPPSDRPPIHDAGYHEYRESEFPEGAGHCDTCGGGPDAAIHHHVDPLVRIAGALEEVAGALHRMEDYWKEERFRYELRRNAPILWRIRYWLGWS